MRGTTRKYSGGEAASISLLTQRGIDLRGRTADMNRVAACADEMIGAPPGSR
jgi:hypothetical protein